MNQKRERDAGWQLASKSTGISFGMEALGKAVTEHRLSSRSKRKKVHPSFCPPLESKVIQHRV